MTWLPDPVVDRLRATLSSPNLNGTRYRAVRFLARGGMAAVWLAEDTVLRRQVALKILDLVEREEDLASRLLREAEILASLEHPGIVPVHDAGTLADGRVFCCMKYVRGKTLDQQVRGLKSVSEGLRLILRIAEPLAFAHSKGVLHRDLKPGNIMIGPFGEVLVMDWGLAKRIDATGLDTATILSVLPADVGRPDAPGSGVVGTPGFISPEQARGEAASPQSDIFSLGAVMACTLANCTPSNDSALCPERCARSARRPWHRIPLCDMNPLKPSLRTFLSTLEQSPVSAYRENLWERAARVMSRHSAAIVLVLAYLFMRGLLIFFARR